MRFQQDIRHVENEYINAHISDRSFTFNGVKIQFSEGIFRGEWTLYIDGVMRRSSVDLYLVEGTSEKDQVSYASSHYSIEETYTHVKNVNTALELVRLKDELIPFLKEAQALYELDNKEIMKLYEEAKVNA